ncbi:MAG: nucleotide exchange factor GrpE [Rhodospirillales bacterium]|nr:nucleotide exchange factor GrpE [Rhodospirillales bacterium]MDE2199885.1 nucleotide exchange factor GrpE [Rhodospirillales bacterium]
MSTEEPPPMPTPPLSEFEPDAVDPVPEAGPLPSAEAVMQAASARIATLEAELAEMRDRWMRSEAEMQNVRHRARREADEARQFAVQGFARDIAEAAENLRRGLDSLPPPAAGESEIIARLREGFAGIERGFTAALERHGVRSEDPTGAPFDPNLHQAMAEQESIEHPPGTVIQAWTPAWTLHARLLRPAMVVVAKAPTAEIAAQRLDTTA